MDHIGARNSHHDGLADRHHNCGIGCQLEFLIRIPCFFELRRNRVVQVAFTITNHEAVEGHAFVNIFVTPVPLVAGDFDVDVAFGDFLLLEQDRQRESTDKDENHDRDDCPRNLEGRVVRKGRRCRIHALVVANDHISQQADHENGDAGDNHQQQAVEPLEVAGQFSSSRLETERLIDGSPDNVEILINGLRRGSSTREDQAGGCRKLGDEIGHTHVIPCSVWRIRAPEGHHTLHAGRNPVVSGDACPIS